MDYEKDEKYIKMMRKLRAMSQAEQRAYVGLPESTDGTAAAKELLDKRADRFFPPYTESPAERDLALIFNNSIQNGDTPEERDLIMSIATSIIQEAAQAGKTDDARGVTDGDIAELEKIEDKLRRMVSDAQ